MLSTACLTPCLAAPQAPAQQERFKALKPNPDELMRFGIAYSLIKQIYVHKKSDNEMFVNALKGMLSGLDPHSVYLDEEALKDMEAHTRGNFTGIGIEITMDRNTVKIISPIDDTPAYKAGLKAGDYIVAVNGKPLLDTPINKVVKLIRGKPGTKLTLTIMNKKENKPREVTMMRQKIIIQSVKSRMLADGYGYIRITQFQAKTGDKLIAAVKKLQKKSHGHLKGLVLDLRNNPGGLLATSVEVADAFLDSKQLPANNKKIVYTKGRIAESRMELKATPGDYLKGAPIIVLINQGSASGSEVVAGALQDYHRAILMGETSFGKGSVQTLLPLDDKTAIKLTTSLYYTPKGRSIQATGIKPDIFVENLKLTENNEEALFFKKIRESHLTGHLSNANDKTKKYKNSKTKKILPNEDYQLHEALTVLKALTLTNKATAYQDT
jgi:carboxyl-terminal processing protease